MSYRGIHVIRCRHCGHTHWGECPEMLAWLKSESQADRVKRFRSQNRRGDNWKDAKYCPALAKYRGDPNGWVTSAGNAREKCREMGILDEKDSTVEIRE